eukprot:1343348-Pleurochrysis_carterae.AAC.1
MTARTVGVSDSEPFQSAAIQGYRGSRKNLNKSETKCKTAKQEWHAKTYRTFQKQQRRELRRYC